MFYNGLRNFKCIRPEVSSNKSTGGPKEPVLAEGRRTAQIGAVDIPSLTVRIRVRNPSSGLKNNLRSGEIVRVLTTPEDCLKTGIEGIVMTGETLQRFNQD